MTLVSTMAYGPFNYIPYYAWGHDLLVWHFLGVPMFVKIIDLVFATPLRWIPLNAFQNKGFVYHQETLIQLNLIKVNRRNLNFTLWLWLGLSECIIHGIVCVAGSGPRLMTMSAVSVWRIGRRSCFPVPTSSVRVV